MSVVCGPPLSFLLDFFVWFLLCLCHILTFSRVLVAWEMLALCTCPQCFQLCFPLSFVSHCGVFWFRIWRFVSCCSASQLAAHTAEVASSSSCCTRQTCLEMKLHSEMLAHPSSCTMRTWSLSFTWAPPAVTTLSCFCPLGLSRAPARCEPGLSRLRGLRGR